MSLLELKSKPPDWKPRPRKSTVHLLLNPEAEYRGLALPDCSGFTLSHRELIRCE